MDGYTLAGWYKESALTNAWTFASDVVKSAITLYAKWTYTVTYNANEQKLGTADYAAPAAAANVAKGTITNLPPLSAADFGCAAGKTQAW